MSVIKIQQPLPVVIIQLLQLIPLTQLAGSNKTATFQRTRG